MTRRTGQRLHAGGDGPETEPPDRRHHRRRHERRAAPRRSRSPSRCDRDRAGDRGQRDGVQQPLPDVDDRRGDHRHTTSLAMHVGPDGNLAEEKRREQQAQPRQISDIRIPDRNARVGAAQQEDPAERPERQAGDRQAGRDQQPDPESRFRPAASSASRPSWESTAAVAASPVSRTAVADASRSSHATDRGGRPAVDAICATVIGLSCHAL